MATLLQVGVIEEICGYQLQAGVIEEIYSKWLQVGVIEDIWLHGYRLV